MAEVWVFPGQGAQRVGMGAEVLERYPELVREADAVLGYPIRDVCLTGAAPGLQDTRSVQPALFVVSALSYLARREEHAAPDFLAGHSLGEYVALFAAGCFDFGTGVRLVQRRGELMGRANGGGMLAVVGVEPSRLAECLAEAGIEDVDQANRNSAVQVVLAGPADSLRRAAAAIKAGRLGRSMVLPVSAPFHSRYMSAVAAEFGAYLAGVELAAPAIPVIANVTARPYPQAGLADLLVRQVAAPVRWWESMSYLLERGVTDLAEVGPGRVLTDLWRAVVKEPAPKQLSEADGPATTIRAEQLGSAGFRADYGLRYAYLAGSMYQGIASTDLVVRMARAGLMGFFGAGGLTLDEIRAAIHDIRERIGPEGRFGMNLLASPDDPVAEREVVELYLSEDVRHVEASAYTQVTAAVVRFRAQGAHFGSDGRPRSLRQVLAKVSRPEVAAAFVAPPPPALLDRLVAEGALTPTEAAAAARLPVAGEICVEADSGGHTDAGSPYALMPAMTRLRDRLGAEHGYPRPVRVGAAGGLGSPEAVAAAFVLGADFVLTGSVNQCSPEAGTSAAVKELLATLDVQDTAYAPAGDMFELGARVQVVRRSTLFAARANKLYEVYRRFGGLDEIDAPTRRTIEERYFGRTFEQVWDETREYLRKNRPEDLARAEQSPKARMAQVFRWYFVHSTRLALKGDEGRPVDYQIHCGPAMGAFNRVVAGTGLQAVSARHVDAIAELLMTGAAELLDGSLRAWSFASPGD